MAPGWPVTRTGTCALPTLGPARVHSIASEKAKQRDLTVSKHTHVRATLNRELVKPGLISETLGNFFNDLYELRTDSDYLDFKPLDASDVQRLVPQGESFIQTIKGLLSRSFTPGWLPLTVGTASPKDRRGPRIPRGRDSRTARSESCRVGRVGCVAGWLTCKLVRILDVDLDATGTIMDLTAGKPWRQAMRRAFAREVASHTSPAKSAVARENGKKGGRPKKKPGAAAERTNEISARSNKPRAAYGDKLTSDLLSADLRSVPTHPPVQVLHDYIESINGRSRSECRHANWFLSREEARKKSVRRV